MKRNRASTPDPASTMNPAATAAMDTSGALRLVPITMLALSMINFDDWKMSVWIYLSYHNLDSFVRDNNEVAVKGEGDNNGLNAGASQENRRRRLLAYSIIHSSCKDVIPFAESFFGMKLRRDDDQLDPKALWEMMLAYHRIRLPNCYNQVPQVPPN